MKDVFATALHWAGAGIDPAASPDWTPIKSDGVSVLPHLQGEAMQIHAADVIFAQDLFGKRAARHLALVGTIPHRGAAVADAQGLSRNVTYQTLVN